MKSCEKSKLKKIFLLTSGCLIYGAKIGSGLITEDSELNTPAKLEWRKQIEKKVNRKRNMFFIKK
jgi:hypothetical protein